MRCNAMWVGRDARRGGMDANRRPHTHTHTHSDNAAVIGRGLISTERAGRTHAVGPWHRHSGHRVTLQSVSSVDWTERMALSGRTSLALPPSTLTPISIIDLYRVSEKSKPLPNDQKIVLG